MRKKKYLAEMGINPMQKKPGEEEEIDPTTKSGGVLQRIKGLEQQKGLLQKQLDDPEAQKELADKYIKKVTAAEGEGNAMKNTGAKKKSKKKKSSKSKKKSARKQIKESEKLQRGNTMEDYYRTMRKARDRMVFNNHIFEEVEPTPDYQDESPDTNNEHVNKELSGEGNKKDDVMDHIERVENGIEKLDKVFQKLRKVVQDVKSSYLQREYSKNTFPTDQGKKPEFVKMQ